MITLAAELHGVIEVRAATNPDLFLPVLTSTFHGRDVFAPLGAHVAAGVAPDRIGPPIEDWIRLDVSAATRDEHGMHGNVDDLDLPFGNVWTNIPGSWLDDAGLEPGATIVVEVSGQRLTVPRARTFGDVGVGEPLLYKNSRGRVALALNQADFAATYGVTPDTEIHLRK